MPDEAAEVISTAARFCDANKSSRFFLSDSSHGDDGSASRLTGKGRWACLEPAGFLRGCRRPFRLASRASCRVHLCAVPFKWAATPPLLAISRRRCDDIDANPQFARLTTLPSNTAESGATRVPLKQPAAFRENPLRLEEYFSLLGTPLHFPVVLTGSR